MLLRARPTIWHAIAAAFVLVAGGCSGSASTTGASCSTEADCSSGEVCVYKISDGCAAKAVCQPLPTGTQCGGAVSYCACSGGVTFVGCGGPDGYAGKAVSGLGVEATCNQPDAGAD